MSQSHTRLNAECMLLLSHREKTQIQILHIEIQNKTKVFLCMHNKTNKENYNTGNR